MELACLWRPWSGIPPRRWGSGGCRGGDEPARDAVAAVAAAHRGALTSSTPEPLFCAKTPPSTMPLIDLLEAGGQLVAAVQGRGGSSNCMIGELFRDQDRTAKTRL